jgi:hypothetical protein
LDCGDAEVLVALGEVAAGGEKAAFGVGWDGGVAINEEVAVRGDAGGIDLRKCQRGEERENESCET